MATAYYNVDFNSLVNYLLPTRLRNSKLMAWLYCLVQPVTDLYTLFMTARAATLYDLAHNSQVVYLQAALNDVFDPITRGIYIADGVNEDPLFVYLDAETNPLWLGLDAEAGAATYPDPQWVYTNVETSLDGYQFIVMMPSYTYYDASHLTALINKYRLTSKNNYAIISY